MKFAVVTHVEHCFMDGEIYGYGPYIKEMNLWFKYVDEVIVIAPVSKKAPSNIDLAYNHKNLQIVSIPSISVTSISESFRTLLLLPVIIWKIFNVLKKADHIHLRCPGNIGLIGCVLQVLFPKKTKTVKYAGNWDPKASQPLSYKLQKLILGNTFFTRNMQVLVYGNWSSQSKNIRPFFTATYVQEKVDSRELKNFNAPFRFIFVGSLSVGKRPLYAVKLMKALYQNGIDYTLDIYGEGDERPSVEGFISSNSLSEWITLHGNQTSETVEAAYKESHFLILPSKSEGWPKVVSEAMFWGVIPIVSSISCVPWMLGNGTRGILLDLDMTADITKIMGLINKNKELSSLSFKAQQWSQKYTLDTFEAEIAKLICR